MKRIGLILNVTFLFLFILLSRSVLEKKTLFYDKTISIFIYSFRTPLLTEIMSTITVITGILSGAILFLLIALALYKKSKKECLFFSLSLIIGSIISYLLKILFKIPRPDIFPLQRLSDFSYPSGHAMNNLLLYGLLVFYAFRFTKNKLFSIVIGFIFTVWIGLLGLSRIYLGVHNPSDVIGGYLIGFWLLTTAILINKAISNSTSNKLPSR
jgi:undecaprenyl-diphosphatase